MDPARKIASDDELRAIATAGVGFIVDPFNRRWHVAICPHTDVMTTGQPKWFARTPAALDHYLQQRLAQYSAAKAIQACPTCGSRAGLTPPTDEQVRNSGEVADLRAEHAVQLRAALREIISEHGPAALTSPAQIANLLKDLLPDAPGISRMLAAAAEERVAGQLLDHASAGLDGATAVRLVASSLASRTLYDPDTCTWLTGEIAAALSLADNTGYTPTATAALHPEARPAERRPDVARPEDRDDDHARAILQILKARGHAPSLQTIYDGLRELGYIPHAPAVRKPGNEQKRYLRWTDPARGGPAVIYFEKADFWFVRTEDLAILRDLPGGTATIGGRQHHVRFPVSPQATGQILQGARRIKR